MIGDFFRRALQILSIAAVAAVLYLNFLSVPTGNTTFLQSAGNSGGIDNRSIYAYSSGVHFIPTLFVPGRWRKYQLETGERVQDIKIRLPLKYSAYLRLNDLFYVQMRLKVEGEIPAAETYAALKGLQYRPTDRDKVIEDHLQFLAADFFIDVNTDERNLEKTKAELIRFWANSNLPEIQKRLDAQLKNPWYKIRNIELKDVYVPDAAIYAAQTKNLNEVAAADRRALLTQIEKEAELALERKRNLEDLTKAEKMAALISENPDLIEYYKIEKIAPHAGNVILDASSGARKSEIHINPTNKNKNSTRGRDGKSENTNEAGGEIGRGENGNR